MVRRLAVLGSPIAHSRSPLLHAAAAEVLGLDWEYGRVEMDAAGLPAFLAGLGPEWLGLSLTMPLKRAVLPLVAHHEALVDRLGLANTVRLGEDAGLVNTDVPGLERVLAPWAGGATAVVLGAGATAASSVEALRRLGIGRTVVASRSRPSLPGAEAVLLAEAPLAEADLVVSTLPGTAVVALAVPPGRAGVPLLDVAYDPWPTAIGAAWLAAGGRLIHGLELLVEQAVLQVRVFAEGGSAAALPREDAVRTAMRRAVGR